MKLIWCVLAIAIPAAASAGSLGQFIEHRDIGRPASPGSASYDRTDGTYHITGVGRNMWADQDDFHFAWKRMSGDVMAETKLAFETPPPAPGAMGFLHRKGGIVLRQDLDPNSAYVDVLRMGNQQMSIQYREIKGGPTRLIWINTPRQDAVRLVKIGDYAYLSVVGADGQLRPAGGSFKVRITGAYYIGLGVCPHDETARETMAFREVRVSPLRRGTARPSGTTLQTIHVDTAAEQTVLYHSGSAITIAGWSPDSVAVYFTSREGTRRAVAWDSDRVEAVESNERRPTAPVSPPNPAQGLGIAHRLSPDGKWMAYLIGQAGLTPNADQDVALRVAPMIDGSPRPERAATLVKLWGNAMSLPVHAWSPDGKTLAFISRD